MNWGGLRDSDAKCVLFAGAQNAEDIAFGRIVFSEKKETLSTCIYEICVIQDSYVLNTEHIPVF